MKQFSRVLVLVSLVVALGGCLTPKGQRKLIDFVNEGQLAAAQTYDGAKDLQAAAQTACAAALRAAGKPLPAAPADVKPMCSAVGSPVPYDPVSLQHAAGPVNALHDAVRAANAQRLGPGADVPAYVLGGLLGAFEQVVADLSGAGIAIPKAVTDTIATLKTVKGAP